MSSSQPFGEGEDSGKCEKIINRTNCGKVSLSPLVLRLRNIPDVCLKDGGEVGRANFRVQGLHLGLISLF